MSLHLIVYIYSRTGDLLRMDTGEELQKDADIRTEKYQQQVFENEYDYNRNRYIQRQNIFKT